MSRSYKGVLPKKNWVYSVEDLMELYSVSANTVSNWVGEGLCSSDGHRPYLFQGASVRRFHTHRRERLSTKLRRAEFKCFTCKAAVFARLGTIDSKIAREGVRMVMGICPECSSPLRKFSSDTDCDIYADCRNPNTSVDRLHEKDMPDFGNIGIRADFNDLELYLANDRTIHSWLTYAGRYNVKTIDRHLAAIRYLEALTGGALFGKLSTKVVSKVRDDLKRRSDRAAPDHLSSSSIRHTVSHLVSFLSWLQKQEGFRRLPKDLPDYLQLPKAVTAATPTKFKDYPTLSEAEALLNAMRANSLKDERARALFAMAFLGALRVDTLVSLRIGHIDIENRLILQDASVVRAKGGKNINIFWFPLPELFEIVVINWIDHIRQLGFMEDDALFPDVKFLTHRCVSLGRARTPVPVMTTAHAATEAFDLACRNSDKKFTPHAVKHTIGAERDERALTQLERKAWSENMGHENEQITERYYGKLSNERRIEVLEAIGSEYAHDRPSLSDKEKIALVDAIIGELSGARGS